MKERIFQIFKECYPQLPITEEVFYQLFDYDGSEIIHKEVGGRLIGFLAIRDNHILLICVLPDYQRMGYGRQLMEESEELLGKKGYQEVILGDTRDRFFLGATTEEADWKEKHNYFFEICGYKADHGCLEMIMPLKDYDLKDVSIPLQPDNIVFEYWDREDRSELFAAVRSVEEDWVQYFQNAPFVYTAMEEGSCVGFTILSFNDITLQNDGCNKVGMVGCVGVTPDKRKHGIGLAMVAHATNELKKQGCDLSYIHYTYLDWWYGKLGYESFLWYWMGKKSLVESV